jgi:DNA-binding winged helix-turn-helix (wHTH) protein/tetratricopeptide (TPR) repeat protein
MLVFSNFRLDVRNACLLRGKQAIVLTPKALNVLRYLVEHAGQLVTKDDLWRAVWPGISVTDATLTVCLSEIRRALGDQPKAPRYIETVSRLGYRFIAPVSTESARIADSAVRSHDFKLAHSRPFSRPHFVARQAELAELHSWWERALAAERQIGFVTGEPGIGKTTLVDEFLRQEQVSREESLWIGRGQCIEHYGTGEAYLPLFDALGRLCREPGGGQLLEVLDEYAPSWLLHMPSLLGAASRRELQGKAAGATHARMLRELADAMEVITAKRPLVLWLEDLHWSDYSTLEWLSFLARRREPARLLVLGTYRPVEVILREHPLRKLKQELMIHCQCKELPLALLSESAVREYLSLRFAPPLSSNLASAHGGSEPHARESVRELAHTIYQRTDGNPLFMVNVVDYLAERGVLKDLDKTARAKLAGLVPADRIDTPPSLVEMIERNLERLSPDEQAVLEAASVAGAKFRVAAVAAAMDRPLSEVEAHCTRLSRQLQFVRSSGTTQWPDGTVTTCFDFQHTMYRDSLYQRIPQGHRIELHERIATRKEVGYGAQTEEVAAELAHHYGLCGKKAKAIKYLEIAGARAIARRSYSEAEQHYDRAIEVLYTLPQSSARDQHELSLQLAFGNVMATTRGFSAAETAAAYDKSRVLAEHAGSGNLLQIFYGLSVAAMTRAEFQAAMAINNEMLKIARDIGTSEALVLVHTVLGIARLFVGDLIGAREHFIQASNSYCEQDFCGLPNHPAVPGLVMRGVTEWHLGYPDCALRYMDQALALARDLNDPFGLTFAHFGASLVYRLLGDWSKMLEASEQSLNVSTAFVFPVGTATAKIFIAYSRAKVGEVEGAVERISENLADLVAVEFHECFWMLLSCLAEVQALSGEINQAKTTIEQALQAAPEEFVWRPELLRLRGELRLQSERESKGLIEEAEQDFRAAMYGASVMSAKSDELRATTSLARLLRDTNRHGDAHAMLFRCVRMVH